MRIREGTTYKSDGIIVQNRSTRSVVLKQKDDEDTLSFVIIIFMICLVVPIRFYLGSVLLMPYRLVLLLALIPCLLGLFTGRSGRIVASDILLFCFWVWASVAVIHVHGFSQIEAVGMHFLETIGPYMLARVYIRNAHQFEIVCIILLRIVLILLPFALYESITANPIVLTLLGNITLVPENIVMETRMGLDRAQVTFEHPILFGMFSASAIAMSLYVLNYKERITKNLKYIPFIVTNVICSASTGALLSAIVQIVSAYWDRQRIIVKNRWVIFFFAILLTYFIVDSISNRTPFDVFVSYLTLNPGSSGWRLLIWEYGSAEVWRHPVFGIGFNDWIRPGWMHTASVDNFWLLNAMRYGLPGLLLLCAAIIAVIRMLANLKNLSSRLMRYRSGYLICVGSLMVGLCTVHIWSAAYVWFMFLLGSAHWLPDTEQVDGDPVAVRTRPGYNRNRHATPTASIRR